jgi:hypothetical protein
LSRRGALADFNGALLIAAAASEVGASDAGDNEETYNLTCACHGFASPPW